MVRERKSPGVKILWVWTLGTAAILVTSVVRMRLRDLESNQTNIEQQLNQQKQSVPIDSIHLDEEPVPEDVS